MKDFIEFNPKAGRASRTFCGITYVVKQNGDTYICKSPVTNMKYAAHNGYAEDLLETCGLYEEHLWWELQMNDEH